jgi:hypothetical protein
MTANICGFTKYPDGPRRNFKNNKRINFPTWKVQKRRHLLNMALVNANDYCSIIKINILSLSRPNFESFSAHYHVVSELRSWWEVPSIAHFCSLFRDAFGLLDFEIDVSFAFSHF